jgi:DNA repair protein RadC
LNGAGDITSVELISKGTANYSVVHPRDVFRAAIKQNSVGIILIHNHPSGSLKPSMEDIKITKALYKAGELLEIGLKDHLIITNKGFYSFSEAGGLH